MVHSAETGVLVSSVHFTLAFIRKGAPVTSLISSGSSTLWVPAGKRAWTTKEQESSTTFLLCQLEMSAWLAAVQRELSHGWGIVPPGAAQAVAICGKGKEGLDLGCAGALAGVPAPPGAVQSCVPELGKAHPHCETELCRQSALTMVLPGTGNLLSASLRMVLHLFLRVFPPLGSSS